MAKPADESRVDARIERSREALRAAIIALISDQEFESLTIRAIAAKAGIGYATFFRHYPDKEALLAEAAEGLIADFVNRLSPLVLAGQGLEAMRALTAFVDENRAMTRAFLIGGGDRVRAEVARRAVALALASPGADPGWLPRDLAATHIVGATLSILAWWLQADSDLSADQAAVILERLVLAPLDLG